MPVTPVIDQVPAPLGVTPPEGPVTVAVNEIDEPIIAVPESAVTEIVGVAFETAVVVELFTKARLL